MRVSCEIKLKCLHFVHIIRIIIIVKSNPEDHCGFNNTGCYRICLYYQYHKTEWLCVMHRLPTFYVLTLGDSHKCYWNIFRKVRREKGSKNEQRFHPRKENIQPSYYGNKRKDLLLYMSWPIEKTVLKFNLHVIASSSECNTELRKQKI